MKTGDIWRAVLFGLIMASAIDAKEPLVVGVDANYSLGMEKEGRVWTWDGKSGDLFKGMAAQGVRGFRVRLWTGDEGVNGKVYATEVVKRALAAGLDPYLVIFLSEDWADLMKQPAPARWAALSIPERAQAVRTYSREIVAHFRKKGLRSHLYEIGNEIDYGICGVYPGKGTKKTPEGLSREHWPQAAELIRASQAGVLEADPEAKFMLHIAHWWDVQFCVGFFRFMQGAGVRIDYAGLSYFPSSNIGGSLEMAQFGEVVTRLSEAVSLPVIVPETAYPSTADFKGQFSRWKKETPGYPLSPDGQRRWLADFLGFCAEHPSITGVYYWSPEWCGEGMWKAFALFDPAGAAKPAWSAFSVAPEKRVRMKQTRYLEERDGRVHEVPVERAKHEAVVVLKEKLAKAGRVNVDYIKAITEAELVVDGYRVHLRASLSGNLDLSLVAGTGVVASANAAGADWRGLFKSLDPDRQRVVVFTRDTTTELEEMRRAAEATHMELIEHPVDADKPLKFGLGSDWQKSGAGDGADETEN